MPAINSTTTSTSSYSPVNGATGSTNGASTSATGGASTDRYDGSVTAGHSVSNPTDPRSSLAPSNVRRAPDMGSIDGVNTTEFLFEGFEKRFDALPTEGRTEKTPWSGYYWAKNKGGISYRWQTNESHTYASPTREMVASMSRDDIAKLSPSEKYDLLVGDYQYPLTFGTKSRNSANEAGWTGYCHGWAQAAIHFDEPEPVSMVNPDGIEIPFSSADIKALLTFYQGEVIRAPSNLSFSRPMNSIGINSPGVNARDSRSYDLNPGSFHMLLGNLLGKGTAFGIDCDNGAQKWNQPVHAFTSEVVERRSPDKRAGSEAVTELVIRSNVTYTMEIDPQHESAAERGNQYNKTETYAYTVELDANGEIVGGQWLLEVENGFFTYHDVVEYFENEGMSKAEIASTMPQIMRFPDYAYFQDTADFAETFRPATMKYEFIANKREPLYGYLSVLGDLYKKSTAQA